MYFFSDKFKVRLVMISCDDIFQITLTESHFLPTSSLVLKSSQGKINLLFLLASKFVSNSLRFHWKFVRFHHFFLGIFIFSCFRWKTLSLPSAMWNNESNINIITFKYELSGKQIKVADVLCMLKGYLKFASWRLFKNCLVFE